MGKTPGTGGHGARDRVVRTPGGLSFRLDVRACAVVALLLVAALSASVVLIGTGDFPIPAGDVLRTLLGKGDAGQEFIVNELRLPRVLVGLLVGASLGLGGALFQSISRNPLGSPDVLGLSQGATAGALVVIVLFSGSANQVALGALAGGLVTGFAIYALAWKRGVHGYRLVLVGIGVSAIVTAVNGYLITKADLVDAARAVVWMTGSLGGRDWAQVWPLLIMCVILVPLVLGNARGLRMTEMGDDVSYALGVRVERVRLLLMVSAVLLTAGATAAAGPVSFVALTAPQLAKRLTRSPGPNLVPAMCMGATLLIVADWASQRAFGADQLPVGVVTGVLGGVYLLWLLVTERKAGRI
ncbi:MULTISPECIES: FecCD family ABC transporter permease [Streptomyces]|uniref:FecCD family ABC transporter permease n=1 Tax=Streptomyces TaxID=1883 RepID=UPI000BE40547|nr:MULTISPECIES: iron chelate uptake ABC transporter family permease subunit [Streptomyces]MDX2555215.1 iron chelate uptake ABC transporter family permease subunit [Streptomyces stelliscabiei]MDX2615568.1 iron chelate uptake ABC transporter family permease subunit [Streptomyces stelliscabiei]MDX2639554.1 iron chelate uptake ABC transporter family permease subunit [Streptomyces stelliscabiei]MDX2664048.1 iron chelate uptake ABC transporter family permease subunit [Streptomyces stelliscabiei]MDX